MCVSVFFSLLRKRFFHFLIFGPFLLFFLKKFFHFCFDLPQVSNCYESDSFMFIFSFFKVLFFLFIFALTFHKC